MLALRLRGQSAASVPSREFGAALRATDRAQDAHRDNEGQLPDDDHPALAPYFNAQDGASDAIYECEAELAQTVPTTVAGLVAVIAYAREHQRNNGEPLFYPERFCGRGPLIGNLACEP